MAKSLHTQVKNVWRASLTDLCEKRCKQKYIDIVDACTESGDVLESAVNEVIKALCPFPAVKISDWFWETKAGRKVAWAQYKLYGKDAITPSQACRLMWGATRNHHYKRLQYFIESKKLHSYFDPHSIGEKKKRQAVSLGLPMYVGMK